MWASKNDYERAAAGIAAQLVKSGGKTTINDQAVKIAETAQLNPDGIRTLVRLANVAAFEHLFSKAAEDKTEDRMLTFDVGDPEQVLNRLHKDAAEDLQVKEASVHYDRVQDFFGDVPSAPSFEKVAEPQPVVPTPESTKDTGTTQPGMAREKFRQAREKISQMRDQVQTEWYLTLEKAAALLRVADSRVSYRTSFEKDAVATLGETIVPELRMIQRLTGAKDGETKLCGGIKIATILKRHIPTPTSALSAETPILNAVKEANAARLYANKLSEGLQWIETNVPK